MKKWIASVVAGAMLAAACMGGASAAVLEQDTPSGSAVVRTSCEVEYSVVIPADVEIPFGALDTALGHVYADVMKLEAGMGVYVAVALPGGLPPDGCSRCRARHCLCARGGWRDLL